MVARASLLILAALGLAGCFFGGGFEAIQPDPNQIMTIRNVVFSASPNRTPPDVAPVPMPTLPPGTPIPSGPERGPTPDDKTIIRPFNLPSTAPAGAIGVVEDVDVNVPPFDTMVKLASNAGSCTAEFVGDSGDVLLTAAHCVYNNGSQAWSGNFTAYLGYNNGTYKEAFDWDCTAIFSGWAQGGYARDYAFVRLRTKATKGLGLQVGLPGTQWTSIGYPINNGNAQLPKKVLGTRGAVNGVAQMLSNPMNQGASGGAWLLGNNAVSVNSFIYETDPGKMYGPVFDGYTTKLYQFVRSGCSEDIIPLGTDPKVATYDSKKVYIEGAPVAIAAGPQLQQEQNPQTCPCQGSEEIVLKNETDDTFSVVVAYVATLDNKIQGANPLSTTIPPRGRRSFGCTLGDTSGNLCPINLRFGLQEVRRQIEVKEQQGTTVLTSTKSVSPDFCADQCLNNPSGGYCLPLGGAAKPVLATLSGFVTDTFNSLATNGVAATKKDLILRFNGDITAKDPCERSDFFRANDTYSNDGIACRTTTAKITSNPDEPRLSLRSPTAARATRVAGAGGTSNRALFDHRSYAPVLEFFGDKGSEEINRLYGGYVLGVQRLNGKLIITTEFGCSAGDDK